MTLAATRLNSLADFAAKRSGVPASNMRPVVEAAFEATLGDRRAWIEATTADEVFEDIVSDQVDLAVFIHRLGARLLGNAADLDLKRLHGWSRRDCACEIYFSTEIGVGFRLVHGLGAVIGSRHRIGRRFTIYQGATVGHRAAGASGSVIGDDVTLFAGGSIIGPVTIGDRAVVGAHAVVTRDVGQEVVVAGAPAVPVRADR